MDLGAGGMMTMSILGAGMATSVYAGGASMADTAALGDSQNSMVLRAGQQQQPT